MAPKYPASPTSLSPSTNITTASLTAPVPVPTHGPGGIFTILAQTTVAAPPIEVINLVRDLKGWKRWNSFCPRGAFLPSTSGKDDGKGEGEGVEEWEGGDGEIGLEEKEGWLGKGSIVRIDVFMNGDGLHLPKEKRSRTQDIVITHLESISSSSFESPIPFSSNQEGKKGYRIAWKSLGWSHWQLHSERVMEFIELELPGVDGREGRKGTAYSCWETFGGVLGSVVRRVVGGQLVDRFGDYAEDVKGFLEGCEVDGEEAK